MTSRKTSRLLALGFVALLAGGPAAWAQGNSGFGKGGGKGGGGGGGGTAAGAPLPLLGATALGNAAGAGGLLIIYLRRRNRRARRAGQTT